MEENSEGRSTKHSVVHPWKVLCPIYQLGLAGMAIGEEGPNSLYTTYLIAAEKWSGKVQI